MNRVDVLISDEAARALHASCAFTGWGQADVVAEALRAYALLLQSGEHQGDYRVEVTVADAPLYLVAGRTEPRRRSLW